MTAHGLLLADSSPSDSFFIQPWDLSLRGARNEGYNRTLCCNRGGGVRRAGKRHFQVHHRQRGHLPGPPLPDRHGNGSADRGAHGRSGPRASAPADESATAGNPRPEDKANAPRAPRHFGDASPTAAKPADRRAGEPSGSTADSPRRKEASASAESTTPITPEQARKTDPSARYYATEGFGTGSDTPSQMNCESPTGEKRVFYLSNGKLTSI